MKKRMFWIGLLVASSVFLYGCLDGPNPPTPYSYKGVELPPTAVPAECGGLEDCGMFACTVAQCWCREAPGSGVVFHAGGQVMDEDDAADVAAQYLGIAPESIRAVKLNALFYNVFYEVGGDERTLTVAVDGTVMETECGV
ncbi:MAG: hypothetical protein PHQ80_01455 [Candidatus ainarchaeum sp.]|nr:hypothetical protein [Candidatus ainarchaeum sp.]MDD5095900.1 hypothetical protein [Candidatus ainarchaeum sp.]